MARAKQIKKASEANKRMTANHDAYSKFSLKNRAAAIGFLQTHMPKEILAEMDLDRLTMASEKQRLQLPLPTGNAVHLQSPAGGNIA